MRLALVRPVSDSIGRCALTHQRRVPIDLDRAVAEHAAYVRRLAQLGCRVVHLPAEPEMPDAVFVEDTAVVLDEIAILTRPGHEARRQEIPTVEVALREHRPIARIEPPATLDGGDVAVIGRTVLAGLSTRTGRAALEQLRAIVEPLGYEVRAVEVDGCLHLKSACTRVGAGVCLVNPAWLAPSALDGVAGLERIDVDPAEPGAANALLVGGTVLHPWRYPRTRARLEARGIAVDPIEAGELAKAEGGLTCCSLIFNETGTGAVS